MATLALDRPNIKRTYGSKLALSGARQTVEPRSETAMSLSSRKRPRLVSPISINDLNEADSTTTASHLSAPLLEADVPPSPCLATSSSPVAAKPIKTKTSLPGRREKRTKDVRNTRTRTTKLKSDVKLEQMHLAISSKPISKTCSLCGMSYIRGSVEDEDLHRSYCKKMSKGIEWPFDANQSACTILAEHIWLGKGAEQVEGKIVSVEGSASGTLLKKLEEIASTVDHAMGAASMEEEERERSRYFLYLASGPSTSLSRVVACAIASRIHEAFRAVPEPAKQKREGCLRFGEDEGAIFCDPQAVPAMIGIHRIWTSPSHRQMGLAQKLLDAVAKHSIYGCSISPEARKDRIAFSQPSRAGSRLFTAWTGTSAFLVFAD